MSVVQSFPYGQSTISGSAGADTTWTGLNTINEPCYTVYATLPAHMVPLAQAESLLEVDNLVPLAGDNDWLGQNSFGNATVGAEGLLPNQFVTKGAVDIKYAATGIVQLGTANFWTAKQIFPTMLCDTLEDNVVTDSTTFQTLVVSNLATSVIPQLNCTSATYFPHSFLDINVIGTTINQNNDAFFPGLINSAEGNAMSAWATSCSGAYQLLDNIPNPFTVIGDGLATIQITLPQLNTIVGTIVNIINPVNIINVRAPVGGILYNLHRNTFYTSDATAYPNYLVSGGGIPISVICIDATNGAARWLVFSVQT